MREMLAAGASGMAVARALGRDIQTVRARAKSAGLPWEPQMPPAEPPLTVDDYHRMLEHPAPVAAPGDVVFDRTAVDAAARVWRRVMGGRGLARLTEVTYWSLLRRFLACLPGSGPVTHADLMAALEARLGHSVRPGTRYDSHVVLTQFFKWWRAHGGPEDPLIDRKRPHKPQARRAALTDEQAAVILASIEGRSPRLTTPRAAALGALILRAGFRVSDLRVLRVEDVDFDGSRIRCRDGKGGTDVWLPLSNEAALRLRRHLDEGGARGGHVFPGGWGPWSFPGCEPRSGRVTGGMRRQQVWRIWQRELAQGLRCTPHQGRHWFAVQLDRSGVPLKTISRLLRHSSVGVTDAYLHSGMEDQRDAIAKLDDRLYARVGMGA
jgi:integrase